MRSSDNIKRPLVPLKVVKGNLELHLRTWNYSGSSTTQAGLCLALSPAFPQPLTTSPPSRKVFRLTQAGKPTAADLFVVSRNISGVREGKPRPFLARVGRYIPVFHRSFDLQSSQLPEQEEVLFLIHPLDVENTSGHNNNWVEKIAFQIY